MRIALILLGSYALIVGVFGITYDRCSLARQLSSMGVPRNELPAWTCIAEHESSYRSWVVGPANSDGSSDYGLFQINNRYWCQSNNGAFSYNQCQTSCEALVGEDLWPSLNCALLVKNQQGWSAWATWRFCNGYLPSIDGCF